MSELLLLKIDEGEERMRPKFAVRLYHEYFSNIDSSFLLSVSTDDKGEKFALEVWSKYVDESSLYRRKHLIFSRIYTNLLFCTQDAEMIAWKLKGGSSEN